jgi:hypothetical protein
MDAASIPVENEPSDILSWRGKLLCNAPFVTWDQDQPHPRIRFGTPEIDIMHSNIQRSARSLTSSISGWCSDSFLRLKQRTRGVLKKAGVKRLLSWHSVHKALPLIGIIAGAAACALWLNNTAAGVFALILLFLLSNIGRSLQHIAGLLRTQSAAALHPAWRAPSVDGPQPNIYISAKAMERLRPWVEDESTLTEESAKAYCSVLLDTLAMLRPTVAGRARVEDS